jgi:radical SAM superfamily enzyme YgiQ (UPF0313 family)
MTKQRVCVISCLGEKSYAEKYHSLSDLHKAYWKNNLLFHNKNPIDVMDYYQIRKGKLAAGDGNSRHVYLNGIVLGNFLLSKGYEVQIYNSAEELYNCNNNIRKFDFFIFSTTFEGGNYYLLLEKAVGYIRSNCSQAKIIIGGLGLYNTFLQFKAGQHDSFGSMTNLPVDYCIVSLNGMDILPDILKPQHLQKRRPEVIVDESPRYSQVDYSLHHHDRRLQSWHSALATSKGCPYKCSFCCYNYLHKKYTEFPIGQVKENLDQLTSRFRKEPLRFLRITDECLNHNTDRFIQIIRLIKRKEKIRWCCFVRGDLLTDKTIAALSDSNCDFVSAGLESASPEILNNMNKPTDLKIFRTNIQRLKGSGVKTVISLLVGYYGETSVSVARTLDYVSGMQPDLIKVNTWSPLPNEHELSVAEHCGFCMDQGQWKHSTMRLQQAYDYATEYFHKNSSLTVLPPETSVFEQWPQLAAEGVTKDEILAVFRDYHLETIRASKSAL